ncbi:ATP-binding protein [Cellulomonas alba]|uniref:Adenylate/guanylate cyclase domain-containing protein n=1 Tax=Cellulomonas alba TaxID=3053467 RepID=A0ABT7SK06_9CELL|nr:adenylate/guanylate cyclase domain-containing protein [Cellulomonas alba]MDM7856354.1 adenylate/guanylate cyclase domain-containing protein [Cellulomonas alba]
MSEPAATTDDAAALDAAIGALEAQRAVLGDDVVATALGPLLERRAALQAAGGGARRLVTVVFADLVDFTALSDGLDPEDVRAVMDDYFARWRGAIERHGGVVEKFIGDAVMAVFGLHVSHEDDAVRAVRAAVDMANPGGFVAVDGRVLHMRVGIDSGEVVVGGLGARPGQDWVAVGPTVNRASRLQAAAPADAVLISAHTHRLVRGLFSFEAVPGLLLKGFAEPVDAWRVVGERPRAFHLDADGTLGGAAVPTIGRERELARLRETLDDVTAEERMRFVTVVGDAGVGKSRLVFELDRWLTERPENTWWLRGRASPGDVDRPLALLRDVLAGRCGIAASDAPAVVRRKLRAGFAAPHRPPDSLAPEDLLAFDDAVVDLDEPRVREADVVGAWLGFAGAVGAGTDREPEALRTEASVALGRFLLRLAREAPVVALLEDLHWADDASLHWLDAADEALHDRPVLVVATARPSLLERRPLWGEGLAHHERLALEPLSRRRSRELVARVLGVAEPPAGLDALVIDPAEGNPFFLGELVAWLRESGALVRDVDGRYLLDAHQAAHVAVPSTLRGVLQARLDALDPAARRVLEHAAVVGRVFWDEAVAALGGGDVDEVQPVLDALRDRELVRRRARSTFEGTGEYLFAHALLRDVAYDGLLRTQRAPAHARAAAWLVATGERSARADELAGVVAEHLELAGDPAAAHWYLRAGRLAAAVHATDEATRLLAAALEHAPGDDAAFRFDVTLERWAVHDRSGERDAQVADQEELDALADALGADPERLVRLDLARARRRFETSEYAESARQAASAVAGATGLADPTLLADALLAEGAALTWANDRQRATDRLTTALEVARAASLPHAEAETLRYLSMVAMNGGDYPRALELLRDAHDVARRAGDVDQQTRAALQTAQLTYYLGRYAEAVDASVRALPRVRASGYRYALAVALGNAAAFALPTGRYAEARAWAAEALDLATRLHDEDTQAVARFGLAAVALRVGEPDEARSDAALALEAGARLDRRDLVVAAHGLLALAALDAGDTDAARRHAFAGVAVTGDPAGPRDRAESLLQCGWAFAGVGELDGVADVLIEVAPLVAAAAGHVGLAVDAAALGARCALDRGDVDAAASAVAAVVDALDARAFLAATRPEAVAAACVEALERAGDDRAARVRSTAAELADRLRDARHEAAARAIGG